MTKAIYRALKLQRFSVQIEKLCGKECILICICIIWSWNSEKSNEHFGENLNMMKNLSSTAATSAGRRSYLARDLKLWTVTDIAKNATKIPTQLHSVVCNLLLWTKELWTCAWNQDLSTSAAVTKFWSFWQWYVGIFF